MAARSKPPTFCSTSTASLGSGLLISIAREMTSFFFRKDSSVMPPPRPVTFSTGTPRSTASTAEEVVVLPMPISPTPRASAFVSMASSAPIKMAFSACLRVMAGPLKIFCVPMAIFRFKTFGSVITALTPTSQTVIPEPKCLARTEAPVLARVRLMVCIRVTDWGALETPSSTTPLSAAKTSRWVWSMELCTEPVMPDS